MSYKKVLIAACYLLACSTVQAATVFYPGVSAPYTITLGDTLAVQSGTMATTNSADYTVKFPANGGGGSATTTLTINAGATLSYAGTNISSISIRSLRDDGDDTLEVINNNGTISRGTGAGAIFLYNRGFSSTAENTGTINNRGIIDGSILTNGLFAANLYLKGAPTVIGDISLDTVTSGDSNLFVGYDGSTFETTTFATQGTISFITNLAVAGTNGGLIDPSTLYINYPAASITNFTVGGEATAFINATFNGTGNGSDINNFGNLYVSADINNFENITTGDGTNPATTNIQQAISIGTNTYTVSAEATHAAVMTNLLNYGNLTLPTATTVTFNADAVFAITYDGGYFPADTYTLLTAGLGIDTVPVNFTVPEDPNLFITFSTPVVVNSNTAIQTTITRTPFQTYASNSQTSSVGAALESLGANNPAANTVALLSAVELAANPDAVQNYLAQLAPSVSAILNTMTVQNQMLQQVAFHLADLRGTTTGYSYGDYKNVSTVWLRPFGDIANQSATDDISGYYATTGGFSLGSDRYISNKALVGLAISYAAAHVEDKANSASATNVNSYQAMLYGSYYFNSSTYLDWVAAAITNNFNASRHININSLNLVADANYKGQQYAARCIWGKGYTYIPNWLVTPQALLQYSFSNQHSYNETGGGAANLQIDSYNSNFLQAGLGGQATTSIPSGKNMWAPEVHAMVLYNIINGNQDTIANFAAGGTNITTNINLPRASLRLGAALTWLMGDNSALKLNYDFEVRENYTDNALYLNFKYVF